MAEVREMPVRPVVGWLRSLRELARGRQQALVLTHDNPDPDAMASAAALCFLLHRAFGVKCDVAYGGIVGRAENRALVKALDLALHSIHRVDLEQVDLLLLVDTQPGSGNHSLPVERVPDVVVDHHPERPGSQHAPLCIVSGEYGATSSLVTELLREAGLTPPPDLATALFYGVKTDTRSLAREAEPADAEAYRWLFPQVDHELLARIEHPRVPRSWFAVFHRAFEKARIYGNVVISDLGPVYAPDLVPEIAEALIDAEDIKWAAAIGLYDGSLYLSVRTNDRRMNAGKQVRQLVADLGGSAGGHGQTAGARLPLDGLPRARVDALRREVVRRLREQFGATDETTETLI